MFFLLVCLSERMYLLFRCIFLSAQVIYRGKFKLCHPLYDFRGKESKINPNVFETKQWQFGDAKISHCTVLGSEPFFTIFDYILIILHNKRFGITKKLREPETCTYFFFDLKCLPRVWQWVYHISLLHLASHEILPLFRELFPCICGRWNNSPVFFAAFLYPD